MNLLAGMVEVAGVICVCCAQGDAGVIPAPVTNYDLVDRSQENEAVCEVDLICEHRLNNSVEKLLCNVYVIH